MDRRGRIALAAAALLLLLSGCFSGRARTGLLHRWTDAEPVAARMYFDGADGTERTQPLPPQQLAELVDMLENMKYRTHAFHTDYFWYGRCGLEIELSDGTFWIYDGTYAELRSASMTESAERDKKLRGAFVEILDGEYWERVLPFFPEAADAPLFASW